MGLLGWGRVYCGSAYAGIVREEPGDRTSFTYDPGYAGADIAVTLKVADGRIVSENGLLAFFDNLVAEGWLEQAQSKALGKREASRFELLVGFGRDCAGAVSVVPPEQRGRARFPAPAEDARELAASVGRSSLSGVQPKLAMVRDADGFRPVGDGELSTHIAKFGAARHPEIIENEYLCMVAYGALVPDDDVAEVAVHRLPALGDALIVTRFDRVKNTKEGTIKRIAFEEFNQILGHRSRGKYDGDYAELPKLLGAVAPFPAVTTFKVLRRILASFLLGNTDLHLKNLALFTGLDTPSLTPVYDQVCCEQYGYRDTALTILGAPQRLSDVKAKHIIRLAECYVSNASVLAGLVTKLETRLPLVARRIREAEVGSMRLKEELIANMEKRWNGTFSLIGKALSTPQ